MIESRTARAWAVHALTASGGALGALALFELTRGRFEAAAIYMLIALGIDSVDGSLARRFEVARLAPSLDGRRLDDIVDYLNFAVVPAVFLLTLGALLHWGLAVFAVMASAYGFAQRDAKTPDDFFLGWPSYWNVLAIYLWLLGVGPGVASALVCLFGALIFVPLPYVYPSKLRRFRAATVVGGVVWIWSVAFCIWFPESTGRLHLLELSLLYPAWYLVLSAWLGGWGRERRP